MLTISPGATHILQALNQVGEAYLVGGCVRDYLLGLPGKDEDICTSLLPQQVRDIFADYPQVLKGVKHGTVGIVMEDRLYEVTTYRRDGAYHDHRRPDEVIFTPSLRADLARRDFTINAMAMSLSGELHDPFGGQADLTVGLIRAVGDPDQRFQEDALRLLRGVRFANRLGFAIEAHTEQAMMSHAALLQEIAAERVADEFLKIVDDQPQGVTRLHVLGLLPYMYPDLEACFLCPQATPYHFCDVGRHAVLTAEQLSGRTLRLAGLLHDLGKVPTLTIDERGRTHFYNHAQASRDLATALLPRLFIPKPEAGRIAALVGWHDWLSCKRSKLSRLLRRQGKAFMEQLFQLKRADVMAQSPYDRQSKWALIDRQEGVFQELCSGPYRLEDLVINGQDLKAIGYRGSQIGRALQENLTFVMQNPARNQRDYLLARAERLLPMRRV